MELYLCRRLCYDSNDEKQWVRFPTATEDSLTIGRSANCDLRLSSIHISRNHAMLRRSVEGFMVKDQNSLLGIHVNGIRIPAGNWHTLKSGDEIEFGQPQTEERRGNTTESLELKDRFVYLVKQDSSEDLDLKPRGPSSHVSAALEKVVEPRSLMKRKFVSSKVTASSKYGLFEKPFADSAVSLQRESEILKENKRLKLMLEKREMTLENEGISCSSDTNGKLEDSGDAPTGLVGKVEHIQTSKSDNHAESSITAKISEVCCGIEKSTENLKEVEGKRKIFIIKPLPIASSGNSDPEIPIGENERDRVKMRDIRAMEQENERLKLELKKKEQELKQEVDIRNQKLEEEHKKIAEELENDIKLRYDRREEELETRLMLEKDIVIEECEAKIQEKEKASTSIESVVNTMENELQCSICSELFVMSTTLNCAHTFCEYCIMEWRNVRDICPVCRQPIKTMTRSLVLDNYIDKVLENLSSEKREIRMKLIEERKELVKKKTSSRNSDNPRRRSNRGHSRGRGNNSRVQYSGIRISALNSRHPLDLEPIGDQPETAILISSEGESSGSDISLLDNDNLNYVNVDLESDNDDHDSDDLNSFEYAYYYDPRYRHRRY